jgi:hypothetical protein
MLSASHFVRAHRSWITKPVLQAFEAFWPFAAFGVFYPMGLGEVGHPCHHIGGRFDLVHVFLRV